MVGLGPNLTAHMVQANMNKGDTMKQVKVCNANGGKNS